MPRAKKPSEPTEEAAVRLHVRIAHAGIASRRQAEQLILEGRVEVNGTIVDSLGAKVLPDDKVRVDGVPVNEQRLITVVMNKPAGVVTTLSDPQGRPTVVKYLPRMGVTLKPVGRLDLQTSGILLLTSDGELAHRLAHPRYGVEKEYEAIVDGIPAPAQLEKLAAGVYIPGGKTKPAYVEVIHAEPSTMTTSLRITIHEGRNRQVRLMCEAIGHPVLKLRRVRVGPLKVKGMAPGECRLVGQEDLAKLRQAVGLD